MQTFISHSETETLIIAKEFTQILVGGDVIALNGELGAGKTLFTKGIARALGITKEITSPTFAIMNVLPADKKEIKTLIHVDTYRLKNKQELEAIGLIEYLGAKDTVCIIEWPELAAELLPKKIISVTIAHGEEINERKIEIKNQ